MPSPDLCRLCLIKSEDFIEIFNEKGVALNVSYILSKHFWFDVQLGDSLQKIICTKCWSKVYSFHEFYLQVKYKHDELKDEKFDLINNSKEEDVNVDHATVAIKLEPHTQITELPYESDITVNPINIIDEDIEDIDNDEHYDYDNDVKQNDSSSSESDDYAPVTKSKRTKNRKQSALQAKRAENVKLEVDYNIGEFFSMKCEDCEHLFETFNDALNHYKTAHKLPGYLTCCNKKFTKQYRIVQHCIWHRNPSEFKCSPCEKCFIDNSRFKNHNDIVHATEEDKSYECELCDKKFVKPYLLRQHIRKYHLKTEETTSKKMAAKQTLDQDNETIRKYFYMHCDLCSATFVDYRDAIAHYKDAHNEKGYLFCCNKKFFKFYRVLQHCEWHKNPEAFKCTMCQKNFSDRVCLQDHMVNIHAPEHERIFKCEKCHKTFSKKHMLTSHNRLNHVKDEDKKFECDICGQKFVILPFLRHHIRRVHQNAFSQICEICSKYFKCGRSYELHYSVEHTNTHMKVQCEKCGRWLKHKGTLAKHMLWHYETSETCKICGRVSPNKRALRSHIKSAHSEPTFKCSICEKMFKKTTTLKEHLAMHAGITDLYKCSYCPKTFRSNANMYAHRKRAHPKEYQENKA